MGASFYVRTDIPGNLELEASGHPEHQSALPFVFSVSGGSPLLNLTTLAGPPSARGYAERVSGLGTARFNWPRGLLCDGGQTLVGDYENGLIREIDAFGNTSIFAGVPGRRESSDTGAPTPGRLMGAGSIVRVGGFVYFSEPDSHTIRRIDSSTRAITTIAGSRSNSGNTNGEGAVARFFSPSHLATDGSQNLFVSDSANRAIRRIDLVSNQVTLFKSFTSPTSVGALAYHAGELFAVISLSTSVHEIRKYDATTGSDLGIFHSWASGSAPTTLLIDPVGSRIFYFRMGEVRSRTLDGTFDALIAGALSNGYVDSNGTLARFGSTVWGLCLTANSLLLTDSINHVVRRVNLGDASVTTFAGSSGTRALVNDVTPGGARFMHSHGVTQIGSDLFVLDSGAGAIRRVGPSGETSTIVSGLSISTASPGSIATDGSRLFHVDGPGTLRVYLPQGGAPIQQTSTGCSNGRVAYSGSGFAPNKLFVACPSIHVVRQYDATSLGQELEIGLDATSGNVSGSYAITRFNMPWAVTVMGDTVYVYDNGTSRLRKIDLQTATTFTLNALSLATPQASLTNDGTYLYLVSQLQAGIFRFDVNLQRLIRIAGFGLPPSDIDGPLLDGHLIEPNSIHWANGVGLYFTNGTNVRRLGF
jgi:hypothetical protein